MKIKKLAFILAVALTLFVVTLLCFSSCSLINRTYSDGKFVYKWNEEDGGYYISADKSVYDEVLVIPASYEGKPVVAISQDGFKGCGGFKSVSIPVSVKKVNYAAFKNCKDLEYIDWTESGVESIGNAAFYECDSLKSISFPKSIRVISNSVLYGCDALTDIDVGDNVGVIMDKAFSRCKSLKRIEIPKTVVRIGDSVFYRCTNLGELKMDKDGELEDIGSLAFKDCTSLKAVVFPKNLSTVGSCAFDGCVGLSAVSFTGGKLKQFGASAFNGCESLDKVEIADIANWCGINFIGDDYSNPIYMGQKVYTDGELVLRLEIPADVKYIAPRAFKNATRIVSVTLPSGFNYEKDKDGNLPIGQDAFLYCYKLVEIHNFSMLQIQLDSYSLAGTGYIGAYVKGGIRYYYSSDYRPGGDYPYGEPGAIYTEDKAFQVNFNGERIYKTSIYEKDGFLFYKNGSDHYLLEYIGTDPDNPASEIFLPELDQRYGIYIGAFFGQRGIRKVVVSDSVNELGHYVFYGCYDLEQVYIPDTVTSMGESVFGKCQRVYNKGTSEERVERVELYVESPGHKVGWHPSWRYIAEDDPVEPFYGQKKSELDWISEMKEYK